MGLEVLDIALDGVRKTHIQENYIEIERRERKICIDPYICMDPFHGHSYGGL